MSNAVLSQYGDWPHERAAALEERERQRQLKAENEARSWREMSDAQARSLALCRERDPRARARFEEDGRALAAMAAEDEATEKAKRAKSAARP